MSLPVMFLSGALAALPVQPGLLAAAGKIEITPTRAVYLAGYGENRRSTGVHDPLWARSLVLRSGGETFALVECDLLGVTRWNVRKIRERVRSVRPERVIVGVTHTHSGPDTYGQWGPQPGVSGVDHEWLNATLSAIAGLIDRTVAALEPASIRFATATNVPGCSKNIRDASLIDRDLAALQVVGRAGKTITTLVNFACHPEILDNHQITSDFPHWLRRRMEERMGGVSIYANGAQGGMITADVRNEGTFAKGEAWPEAERIGSFLADAALGALAHAPLVANPRIAFSSRTIRVPLENAGFRALIAAGIFPQEMLVGDDIETEVARFTVGPAEFVTFPGEALPAIGMAVKSRMAGSPRFELGLTCDALGYILQPDDFGKPLYHYETSVSVGKEMGARVTDALIQMVTTGPKPNR